MAKNNDLNSQFVLFNPTFTFATPGDLGVSYGSQSGRYALIGPAVFVVVSITFTPTFTTSAGAALINAAPFAATQESSFVTGNMNANWTWPVGITQITPYIASGATTWTVAGNGTIANRTDLTTANITSGVSTSISFSGFYFRSY